MFCAWCRGLLPVLRIASNVCTRSSVAAREAREGGAPCTSETAREQRIERSGGRTNIVRARTTSDPVPSVMDKVATVGVGMALVVVPAAVIDAMGVVDIPDTGGLVRIIDLDTIFVVFSSALTLVFLARYRAFALPAFPYILFSLGVATVTTVLMAYVVTNLGTLYRLRLIPAAWIWLLPLALAIWCFETDGKVVHSSRPFESVTWRLISVLSARG